MSHDAPSGRRRPRSGRWILLALGLVGLGLAAIWLRPHAMPQNQPLAAPPALAKIDHLRPISDFASIRDPQARSIALFEEAGRVIQHPRCLNCHPRDERPTQTDAMRPHEPWVTRGADGGGAAALRCAACHQDANFGPSKVPGNPKWRLAPAEMAWQGRSLGEICRQIQDPARSHMGREALLRHMAQDELVGWAWRPGGGRTPAPGTQAEFGALVQAWMAAGGHCPA